MKGFHVATWEDVKQGRTTDVYFQRTKKILEAKHLDNLKVTAEVTTGTPSERHSWGVLCGVEEVAELFKGIPVDIDCMPEGTVFRSQDAQGYRCPAMSIKGTYHGFCEYETPLLGFICQESAIASRAAYVRVAAGDKTVVAFGIRRMHPALAPAIDRASYIGGLDSVSSIIGAETCGVTATGTMPHALMIMFQDQVAAWKAYHEVVEPEAPRVILVDTYYDEKTETIMATEALKDALDAVRLDTPSSRRGDFGKIIKEVRWELDLRGYSHVKILVSGGLNEHTVAQLGEAGADAFGVGTWVSGAPTLDFAMDIVELEGKPVAKRGKLGGAKQVWRCSSCMSDTVTPLKAEQPRCSVCGGETTPMLKPLIRGGELVAELPTPKSIRSYVLEQLSALKPEPIG